MVENLKFFKMNIYFSTKIDKNGGSWQQGKKHCRYNFVLTWKIMIIRNVGRNIHLCASARNPLFE